MIDDALDLVRRLAARQCLSRWTGGWCRPAVLVRRGQSGGGWALGFPRRGGVWCRDDYRHGVVEWLVDAGLITVGEGVGDRLAYAPVRVTPAGMRAARTGRLVIASSR